MRQNLQIKYELQYIRLARIKDMLGVSRWTCAANIMAVRVKSGNVKYVCMYVCMYVWYQLGEEARRPELLDDEARYPKVS